jgi:large subunit ribosomal protein L7e
MVKKGPKQVPESVRKLQARIEQAKQAKAKASQDLEAQKSALAAEAQAKAEKYLAEYIHNETTSTQNRAQAKKNNQFWVESEAKVILVVRIKGINKIAPKPRKVLKLFRLLQLHNAVLVRNNKATRNMLRLIEPFVTFGYPSVQTISKLVYKRGYIKVNNQRIPLNDNVQISAVLGSKGIHCVEDLIHQLVTCGACFKECNNLLWTFKLSSPIHGFNHKRTSFIQGGDWGNREKQINNLVNRMI